MNSQRIAGIAMLVVGVGLWITGMNAKDSVADRWTHFFTGHFTDSTAWYILGGIGLGVFGLVTLLSGRGAKAG